MRKKVVLSFMVGLVMGVANGSDCEKYEYRPTENLFEPLESLQADKITEADFTCCNVIKQLEQLYQKEKVAGAQKERLDELVSALQKEEEFSVKVKSKINLLFYSSKKPDDGSNEGCWSLSPKKNDEEKPKVDRLYKGMAYGAVIGVTSFFIHYLVNSQIIFNKND